VFVQGTLQCIQNLSAGVVRDETERSMAGVGGVCTLLLTQRCLSGKHNQICVLEKSPWGVECEQGQEPRSRGTEQQEFQWT
jgi:hypothetical protein